MRHIVEAMQHGVRAYGPGMQHCTVVHLGGDMSAVEPARAAAHPWRDAHTDSIVPYINALQKCRSGCVTKINNKGGEEGCGNGVVGVRMTRSEGSEGMYRGCTNQGGGAECRS